MASASSPARTAIACGSNSRPGNDLTYRFPLIVEALARLRSRSCIVDGEAVACDDDGMPSFDRIRYRPHDASVFLYAFDLIELNGDDLRRDPLEVRKATLSSVVAKAGAGIRFNEHLSQRPLARLAQNEEPRCTGGEAGGGGGLEEMTDRTRREKSTLSTLPRNISRFLIIDRETPLKWRDLSARKWSLTPTQTSLP
jgi:ATP dependent DNA ligase domain